MSLHCPRCGHDFAPRYPALTKRQAELLRYLETHIATHGYAPSFDEIAAHSQFHSLATVHEHLTNLERKGFIRRGYAEARGITVIVRFGEIGAPTPVESAV